MEQHEEAHSLLIISIGPVQDFISSARRCQDLWFGSQLLSDLAVRVALAVRKACGAAALVFPDGSAYHDEAAEEQRAANRIVARIPTSQVAGVTGGARRALDERLACLHEAVFNEIEQADSTLARYVERAVAERQIKELIELCWVAVPCAAAAGDAYRRARARRVAAGRA